MSSPATPLIPPLPLPRARLTRLGAATLAAIMVATLAPQAPALAQPSRELTPPDRERDSISSVDVRKVRGASPEVEVDLASASDKPAPVWPAGGSAVAVVPGGPARPAPGGELVPDGGMVEPARTVEAGGLP